MASETRVCTLLCALVITLVAVDQTNAAMSMEQIQKTATNLRNTCASKVNANIDIVTGIQKGEFPEDRALKCYALCVLKTMRSIKNGRVDEATMIKQVELMMPAEMAAHLKETTKICAAEPPGGDDCETAFNYVKCSYKNDPDFFFFP